MDSLPLAENATDKGLGSGAIIISSFLETEKSSLSGFGALEILAT